VCFSCVEQQCHSGGKIAQSRRMPPALLSTARQYGVRACLDHDIVQHFRGVLMVQGFENQAQIGSRQARNPSLAVCGPRRSCGGAVLGRFGVFFDELCQLGHCCRKGSIMAPKFSTGLLGRAVIRVCRVSSRRFDFGCQLLAWGHSHDHRQIDWECLADFLTHNPSRPADQRRRAGSPE
jgi:hypothetical protein